MFFCSSFQTFITFFIFIFYRFPLVLLQQLSHYCWWDLWLPVLFGKTTFCHSTNIICNQLFDRPESCLSLFQRETLCLDFFRIRWSEPRIGRDSCPRIASCRRQFDTLRILQLVFEQVGLPLVVELSTRRLVVAVGAASKPEEVEEEKRYSRTEKDKLIELFWLSSC